MGECVDESDLFYAYAKCKKRINKSEWPFHRKTVFLYMIVNSIIWRFSSSFWYVSWQCTVYPEYQHKLFLPFFRRGYAGMLPIHAAALNGYVDCVRKLRAAMPAIDINIPDDFGRTCLHGAACSGWVFPSCLVFPQWLCRTFSWVTFWNSHRWRYSNQSWDG